jgi:transcriptional regulator with XRE-family HTH domain
MPPRTQSRDPETDLGAFLGRQLKEIRIAAGYKSQDEFASLLSKDRSVVGKAESGEYPPTDAVLTDWLNLCGIEGRLRTVLFATAKFARMRDGGPVKVWFVGWVDAEGKAHTLRIWQPIIVPGIVQTPAYARELFAAMGMNGDQVSDYVQSRLSRQAILDRADPPSVVIVLDELALHRLIGTPEIMREQLERLLELSKRPNIHIHILPTRTGANAGLGGPIHLATGIGSPEVLLVGALIEDQVSADPALVRRASATFDGVRGDALNRADSRNVLMEAHQRWSS